MYPEPTEPDYADLSPKELAERGIFTPLLKHYDDQENSSWIVANQKIVAVDPGLPGLQDFIERQKQADERPAGGSTPPDGEMIKRPPALENSLENFFRSLLNLLTAWLRWLFGGGKPQPQRPAVSKDGTFRWSFEGNADQKIDFKIVRASECPNEESEFGKQPSVNVLLTWKEAIGQGDLAAFEELRGQADNHFISNPQPPSHGPKPPVEADAEIMRVYASDFQTFDSQERSKYAKTGSGSVKKDDEPIVAVVDTGLKYKWDNYGQELKYADGTPFQFNIAEAPGSACRPGSNFGYCSIGDYLHHADAFTQLRSLRQLTKAQIKNSPFDDHRVDEKDGEVERIKVGRHGTFITAILNRYGCQVLPVKSFNCAARGTLFDVLDGLNYLIAQKREGMPIQILNASFSGTMNAMGAAFFYKKMKSLTDLGVWVVAAAGNQGISLDGTSIYPAQFGWREGPYFLEKVITVNSEYLGSRQGNTGAAVSITARSPKPDGFPSAILTKSSPDDVIQGTSFAAPYVACALAAIDTAGLSREEVLTEITSKNIGGVTFSKTVSS